MSLHYSSLLLAIAFSGFSVLVAAFASWMNTRRERYLVLGAVGLVFISAGVALMSLRNGYYTLVTLLGPFSPLLTGMAIIYASVRAFVHKTNPWPPILVGAAGIALMAIAFMSGYLGVGNIVLNTFMGVLLILCGIEYAGARDDMRSAMVANSALYIASGLSFFVCAISVAASGEWEAYPYIDNWADNLNAVMSLVGVSGIGALTLTLHFSRSARRHRADAQTDALTGVLNRRALFERFAADDTVPGQAVLIFDLDYFKSINDRHGHAEGDRTLCRFGELLRSQLGEDTVIARIGGEEFCAVLPVCNPKQARGIAETVRLGFAAMALPSGRDGAPATVSVGMATGGLHENFESVLSRADAALYVSKRSGRNQVCLADNRLAA